MKGVREALHAGALHHPFSASLGDLIAVAALALAWLIFRLDRAASDRGEVRAATALLRGVRDQFFQAVGPAYFSRVYTPVVAQQRARSAAGRMDQVWILPVEPIAALIADQRAVEARLISPETMIYGTYALWQMSKINELVRKQAVFNAVHAPDFVDKSLSQNRRAAVAEASIAISAELHGDGIGDARKAWYTPFEESVDKDWQELSARRGFWKVLRRYVSSPAILGDLGFAAALVVVVVAYTNSL